MDNTRKVRHQWIRAILVSAGFAATCSPVLAQQFGIKPTFNLKSTMYIAKFVCGFQAGQTPPQLNTGFGAAPPIPPQNAPDYRSFQPGSYSTTLNIFNPINATATFSVSASVDGATLTPNVASVTLAPFRTRQLGCEQIASQLSPVVPGGLVNGELVEGFLYFNRLKQDLDAQVVYSYSSLDAFQEFRGDGFAGTGGGGGAGGLGLGASVDIERISPIEVENGLFFVPKEPNP